MIRGFQRKVQPGVFAEEQAPQRDGSRLGIQLDGLSVAGLLFARQSCSLLAVIEVA
jgi:hypothetical protein